MDTIIENNKKEENDLFEVNRNSKLKLDLSNVPVIPIYLIAGRLDDLCTPEDIEELKSIIEGKDPKDPKKPKNENVSLVYVENAGHNQLITGPDLSYIKEHVLPALRKHTKKYSVWP